MKRVALWLSVLGLVACRPAPSSESVMEYQVRQVMLPAYARWDQTNAGLLQASRAFCEGGPLAPARAAWQAAQRGWSALQPALLVPETALAPGLRVQFWPDKKNLVARQVEALLAAGSAPTAASLARASVALQGLSAAEYALFDDTLGLDEAARRQRYCPLLLAIGEHQRGLSSRLAEAWQARYANELLELPNARYGSREEVMAELLRSHVTAIDVMKKKMGVVLGPGGEPQPYQAEAWRSGASLGSLAATLATSQRLWADQGLRALVVARNAGLAERIDARYGELLQALAAPQPVAELVASQAGRERLGRLHAGLQALQQLYSRDVATLLEVQLGFNGTDGD